jgi:Fanconi anemia group M protein
MGVSLLYTRDEQDTAQMLYVLAKREDSERGERKVHPHKSHRSLRDEQEFIISAFPDIGMKNARLLLSHFGSVQAITNAEPVDLHSLKGIGEKTGEKIYNLCRHPYK